MRFLLRRILVLAVLLAAPAVWAGGSGLNVIVVVNQNSTNSVRLGNDYCELRGVPPQNVFRMADWALSNGSIEWTWANFTNHLFNPLMQMLVSRQLTNQAQFVLLSMDIPYRIEDGKGNANSTTSALFYGFKTNTTSPVSGYPTCSLPDDSSNSYAFSELPFSSAWPTTARTNSFLAMMLTDSNLAGAELVLRRSVAGDSTFPAQTVYLAQTSDSARNVRYWEFDNTLLDVRVRGDNSVLRILSSSANFTNLLGLLTGLVDLTLPSGAFVPGGFGDSLTSNAGMIFESTGQSPALVFLEAGAAGSYGTVIEPCNWTQKFPSPADYFYQLRGFTLAEAYYQSVLNPFQGLTLGDPLSAPFANPADAFWTSLADGAVLSGSVPITPSFSAGAVNLPLGQVDLFVDGTFFQTMTNLPPAAGNTLSVVLNGTTARYTVPGHATLASVTTGLANAINALTNRTQIVAYPIGDRLELDGLNPATPGGSLNVSVSTSQGSAPALMTQLLASRPVFLDSMATGYVGLAVSNTPAVGDWVQLSIQKTNGTVVKVAVTNSVAGATNNTAFIQNLYNLVNSTAALQSADGVVATDFYAFGTPPLVEFNLYARTPTWPAAQIKVTLTCSANLLVMPSVTTMVQDNLSDLMPRNHVYLTSGLNSLAVNYLLDTTRLMDGYHTLTAVAYEGSSVRTQSPVSHQVVVQNTPLSATLTPILSETNTTLEGLLQFAVSANEANLAAIQLFSTGGQIGVVLNQPSAVFPVSFATLGVGLHPFYAVVTDTSGNQYRTPTAWYRFPLIQLSLSGPPYTLSWPALPGQTYFLLSATNAAGPYLPAGSITPTGSPAQWPIPATGPSAFYQVRTSF